MVTIATVTHLISLFKCISRNASIENRVKLTVSTGAVQRTTDLEERLVRVNALRDRCTTSMTEGWMESYRHRLISFLVQRNCGGDCSGGIQQGQERNRRDLVAHIHIGMPCISLDHITSFAQLCSSNFTIQVIYLCR